jgi:hypothetical protein
MCQKNKLWRHRNNPAMPAGKGERAAGTGQKYYQIYSYQGFSEARKRQFSL